MVAKLLVVLAAMVASAAGRRFIFSLNPGYSGSAFLSTLLNTAADVKCFHERKPAVVGFPSVMREGLNNTYNARKASKVTAIYNDLREEPFGKRPRFVYCDTSHMFQKSWYDVTLDDLLKQGHQVHIVHMRRYLPDALRSAMAVGNRGWSPSKGIYMGGEYTVYQRGYALLEPLHTSAREEDTVELIIGYLLDQEAQSAMVKAKYPKAIYHNVFTENLTNEKYLQQFFTELGIEWSTNTTRFINGVRANHGRYHYHTSKSALTIDPLAWRSRVLSYIDARRKAGLWVPELPQLSHPAVYEDPHTGVAMSVLQPQEEITSDRLAHLFTKFDREVFSKLPQNTRANPTPAVNSK